MLMEIIKDLLKIIYYSINIFVIIYTVYYIITSMFSFLNRKNMIRKYRAKHKFAIVIAARNEEKVIPHFIR